MKPTGISKELKDWINGDPKRVALMVKKAPIGASTLRAIVTGRYVPAERLEKAVRGVMQEYPMPQPEKAAV